MKTLFITDKEIIEQTINESPVCYVGMVDGDDPYVIPMNFGYNNGTIYLHSGPKARSIDILNRNNKVCITFSTGHQLTFQHPQVACSYSMKARSVLALGNVRFIESPEEKTKALNIIMKQYSDKAFKYSDPAVANVKIWEIKVIQMTCKEFGVSYKDRFTSLK